MPPKLENLPIISEAPNSPTFWQHIKKSIGNSIKNLLGQVIEKPKETTKKFPLITRAMQWVRGKIFAVAPELKSEPTQELKTDPKESPASEIPPESIPTEFSDAQIRSQELQKEKNKKLAEDFMALSQTISPQHTANKELNEKALTRLKELKKGGEFKHDDAWLQKNHCSENITNKRFTDAKILMNFFLRSLAHRNNQMGTSKGIGVAIDYASGMAVVLFDQNSPLSEKNLPEESTDEITAKVLEQDESASKIDIFVPYLETLQKQLEKAQIGMKALPPEKNKAERIFILESNGKKLMYTLKESFPPVLIRIEASKQVKEVAFENVIEDFSKSEAPASREKPEHIYPDGAQAEGAISATDQSTPPRPAKEQLPQLP